MTTTTWVVQHGLLLAADPETLPFRYATPLYDTLTVGPQHTDAGTELLLRQAAGMASDLDILDEHQQRLGGDLVLLVESELTRLLGALWWIDVLSQRGADLRPVRLAIVPPFPRAPEVVEAVRDATPIGVDLQPLRELRRAIVEDSDSISLPLGAVSEARRPWATVSEEIGDLLPDARGLDAIDALLVEHSGTDWTRVPRVIGNALDHQDDAHRSGDGTMFDRLLLLAEHRPAAHWRKVRDDHERTPLVEVKLEGPIAMRFTQARRTPFGEQVLAGRDALEIRAFDRWLGGRFLTRDRILRAGLRRE